MEQLPDELIAYILDYLGPYELVNLQRASSRLLKLSRDNQLWRSNCFDRSPCASTSTNAPLSSSALSGLLQSTEPEENGGPLSEEAPVTGRKSDTSCRDHVSARTRAIADWDLTNDLERVDWYSEYVARHATLNASWLKGQSSPPLEVRGLAISKDSTRAFGPLEDGALCIWDIGQTAAARPWSQHTFREAQRSAPSILFGDRAKVGEPSTPNTELEFSGPTECIAIDSDQQKAYIAVGDILNEVDLETLKVVDQSKYAWPITAMSQEDSAERPLTIGTSWSLHLHDPRMRFRERSRSPEDCLKMASTTPEDSIAFLPNYNKGNSRSHESNEAPLTPPEQLASTSPQSQQPSYVGRRWVSPFASTSGFGFGSRLPTYPMPNLQSPFASNSTGQPPNALRNRQSPFLSSFGAHSRSGPAMPQMPRRSARRSTLHHYAQVEPGPLSIVHQGQDNIFIAGRFPSILSYDRRYFPKLQYVIHSGARLAALSTLPFPPCRAAKNLAVEATLLACGEYNGRGSLEIYSLPHLKQNTSQGASSVSLTDLLEDTSDGISPEAERAFSASMKLVDQPEPFNYKNRQAASPAKLLSVALQGTRIVFSDAEGGLKWVERDGAGLVRRWNVNDFEMQGNDASVQGEQVVRKIIPVNPPDSERGSRGDGDLLVWTGEKVGVVSTQRPHDDVDELNKAFGDTLGSGDVDTKAEEYARAMRRALERQADERRWMSRFNMRYR